MSSSLRLPLKAGKTLSLHYDSCLSFTVPNFTLLLLQRIPVDAQIIRSGWFKRHPISETTTFAQCGMFGGCVSTRSHDMGRAAGQGPSDKRHHSVFPDLNSSSDDCLLYIYMYIYIYIYLYISIITRVLSVLIIVVLSDAGRACQIACLPRVPWIVWSLSTSNLRPARPAPLKAPRWHITICTFSCLKILSLVAMKFLFLKLTVSEACLRLFYFYKKYLFFKYIYIYIYIWSY